MPRDVRRSPAPALPHVHTSARPHGLQGRFLATPELVPFRLTRDVVDGMGINGTEVGAKSGGRARARGRCVGAAFTVPNTMV